MAPTLDFIGCHHTRYFAIETKAPGGKPTPRQCNTMYEIQKAGGKTFVIDGNYDELQNWLVCGSLPQQKELDLGDNDAF